MAAADVTIEMTSNGSSDGWQPKSTMDVIAKGGVTKTIADYPKICAVHKDKDAGGDRSRRVCGRRVRVSMLSLESATRHIYGRLYGRLSRAI
jgi:hypothetical protein